MFDLHHLKQFIAVAEELHFGRAAKRLHIAQPPLSQAIKRLEERLGVMLLERTKRKVSLTPAGKMLLEEARRLIDNADRTGQMVQQAALGNQGKIAIGFVSAALYNLLPQTLRSFRNQFPQAQLSLQELTTNDQLHALQAGSIDVGFAHPPFSTQSSLKTKVVSRDVLLAAIPHDHRLAQQEQLDFYDVARQPFVLFPARQGPSLHSAIVRACDRFGANLTIAAEASRIHTQLSLVAGGLGITLIPQSAISLRVRGVVYKKIHNLPESLYLELSILYYQSDGRDMLDRFISIVETHKNDY